MGDGSSSGNSHSIFESILNNLKKIQDNLAHEMHLWEESEALSTDKLNSEKPKDKMLVLDEDNKTLDLKISMGLHRKLLDHEVESINTELGNLLKNKESIEYLLSLVEKRERIAHQIDKIDSRMGKLEKELEKGVS